MIRRHDHTGAAAGQPAPAAAEKSSMLQAIRSRAGSFVVKALFGFLILSFAVWGIGDIFRNHGTDTTVATVGGQEISAQDLQDALRPALERLSARFGGTVTMDQAKQLGVIDEALRQLVDRSLGDQEAAHLRLDVSDRVIRDAIIANPNFRGAGGGFDRNVFNQVLAANHLSEDQFVGMLRRDVPRADLFRAVMAGAMPPPELVDTIYRYRNEKRVADIVALPASAAPDPGQPGAAALDAFYKAHQDDFRAPEYRALTIASLSPDDIANGGIKVPEAKLKAAYAQRQDEFQLPERRQVEQILVPAEDKAKAAESALAAGKGWQEVATTIAGDAPDTLDLGLVKEKDLPPELAKPVFALAPGKPSAPIHDTLGWHILRVTKIVPPASESFAEAKPQLVKDVAHDEAVNRIYTIANNADDALAGGARLTEAAAKYGLKMTSIAAVDEEGRDPQGKQVKVPVSPAEVLKLAFATDRGQTSRITETKDNAIYAVRVDKVVPPAVKPLAAVKAQAIALWQAEQRRAAVAKEAEALAKMVTPGSKLTELAAKKALTATTSPPLLRNPTLDPSVPATLVSRLFAAKPGGAVSLADASGAYVAQLVKIEDAKSPSAAETKNLTQELTDAIEADLGTEYTEALRRRFPVERHRETLDRMF
jgi:peptidyl-prolyl cis-trans isomerase D